MVEEHFQIYGDYWKMYIATQKIESRNFYLCPPQAKLFRRFFLSSPQAEGNYLSPFPQQHCFVNLFSPCEGSAKLTIGSVIRSVNRFRCFESKGFPNSFLIFSCENILRPYIYLVLFIIHETLLNLARYMFNQYVVYFAFSIKNRCTL